MVQEGIFTTGLLCGAVRETAGDPCVCHSPGGLAAGNGAGGV